MFEQERGRDIHNGGAVSWLAIGNDNNGVQEHVKLGKVLASVSNGMTSFLPLHMVTGRFSHRNESGPIGANSC